MQNRLSVFLLTFSILTALILPVSALFPTESDTELYDNIIRLHVIANSDSASDQELKLKVRDGILGTVSEILEGVDDRAEAERILIENLSAIEQDAAEVLAYNGYLYDVSVTLTVEEYPTRIYNNISLPAGSYTSLRVLIGEAAGQNWWCILFPKLCVTSETDMGDITVIDDTEELIEAGLTPSQIRIITGSTPDVKIKFRILEFFGSLLS